jgi:hypothetical protein
MRIDRERNTSQAMDITPVHIIKEFDPISTPGRPKFAISVERKLEHLWLESESRGWSFSDFTVVVMEVLTVLHHRNKVRRGKTIEGKLACKQLA